MEIENREARENLSARLMREGFCPVAPSQENDGGVVKEVRTNPVFARSWGYNNGITAVWDEQGSPWLIWGRFDVSSLGLTQEDGGAEVPHSNDMGEWLNRKLPDPARR